MKPGLRKRPRTYQRRPNESDRKKYFLARWSRLRKQVLARDHGLCVQCKKAGRVKAGNHVDHIEMATKRPDLFWRAENLQTLCQSCHSRKTAAETGAGRG